MTSMFQLFIATSAVYVQQYIHSVMHTKNEGWITGNINKNNSVNLTQNPERKYIYRHI